MSLVRMVSVLLLVVLAGCTTGSPSAGLPTTTDGEMTRTAATTTSEPQPAQPAGGYAELFAQVVGDVPTGTTVVDFSNETVQNSSQLTRAIEKAVEANERESTDAVLVKVDASNYETVQRQHESLPLAFELDDGTQTGGVVYVRHEGHVVMLRLTGILD